MNLKRIIEIFPLLGGLLILLGYLKLYLFYEHWNIPIIDYLDLSEITVLFLSDGHIIFAFIAIYLFPLTLGMLLSRFLDDLGEKPASQTNAPTNAAETNTSQSVTSGVDDVLEQKKFKRIFIGVIFLIPIIFIWLFFKYNKIWQLYFSLFGFMQFVTMYCDYIFKDKKKAVLQTTFVATATAFAILVSHYDICKTESNARKYEITITTNDSIIKTTPEEYYVGKTNHFVFLYNRISKASRIVKTDRVNEIVIRER